MNIYEFISEKKLEELIECAFEEDRVFSDTTSSLLFPGSKKVKASIYSKSEGVLCGSEILKKVFLMRDPSLKLMFFKNDGEKFSLNEKIVEIKGEVKSILSAERTALNFLSKLSGIATTTFELVKNAKGKVKILDTRKTTPCFRELEKYAVFCGGGENHRKNLEEMVLIKENHLFPFSSIKDAVEMIRKKRKDIFIEVEVKNIDEFSEAVSLDIERIMLDNFSIDDIKKAISINKGRKEIEISGGITPYTIENFTIDGVDYISSGFITHSARSSDFTLLIDEVEHE